MLNNGSLEDMNESEILKNGWDKYSVLLLSEFKRNQIWQKDINENLTQIKIEIATLKVKSALWGSIAAIVLTALINFALISFETKGVDAQKSPVTVSEINKLHNEINELKQYMRDIREKK